MLVNVVHSFLKRVEWKIHDTMGEIRGLLNYMNEWKIKHVRRTPSCLSGCC